jgi:hypothetical protein
MTVHVFFTYPETAQKSLEEIDYLFNSDVHPWKSAKVGGGGFDEQVRERRRGGGSVDDEKTLSGEQGGVEVGHKEDV